MAEAFEEIKKEYIKRGMIIDYTRNARALLIRHTCKLAVLNEKLDIFIRCLSFPYCRQRIKNKAILGLLLTSLAFHLS